AHPAHARALPRHARGARRPHAAVRAAHGLARRGAPGPARPAGRRGGGAAVSAPRPTRRPGPWLEAVLLAAALLASELACDVGFMLDAFGRAKVLGSLQHEAGAVAGGLVATALLMLATVVALTLLACRAWVACSRPARAALVARLGGSRAARLAVHAGATLAFVNVLYSLQQFVAPGSRLRGSWAAMLSGA